VDRFSSSLILYEGSFDPQITQITQMGTKQNARCWSSFLFFKSA